MSRVPFHCSRYGAAAVESQAKGGSSGADEAEAAQLVASLRDAAIMDDRAGTADRITYALPE